MSELANLTAATGGSLLELFPFQPLAVITIDFETYYDDEYQLRKLTTEGYVRDERFEVIGVGVAVDGLPSIWMEERDFRAWAATVPWDQVAIVSHKTHFDGLILAYHYGIRPGMWMCTLSMSRAINGTHGRSNNLDALMQKYGLGSKGTFGVSEDGKNKIVKAKGKHRKDFTPAEWLEYGEYCKTDVDGCRGLFWRMNEGFPESELWVIDTTIRMFTEPKFVLHEQLVQQFVVYERQRKKALLDRIEKDKSLVLSNEKFAALLIELGESPEMKVTPQQMKKYRDNPMAYPDGPTETYAFAKSDSYMQGLLESDNEFVRWAAEARIALKSTINETRAERFLKAGRNGRPVPVYLNYYGAHTGRWSGADRMNMQNLERTNKKNPLKGILRKALYAPAGYKIVAADSGQIEARGTAWLAGHVALIEAFRQKRDVYSETASTIYGRHVDRKNVKEDELPGQVGKVSCWAAETPVLTERGWVPIVEVRQTDRVWDGVEWVSHQGVVDQGEREVWESRGVAATPDHEILTEHGWREWSEVLTESSLFQSARRSASSPSPSGFAIGEGGTQRFDVRAVGKGSFYAKISSKVARLGAGVARLAPRTRSDTRNTEVCSPTITIAAGFSIDSLRALAAATIRRTRTIGTTALEAFRSSPRGVKIAPSFFDTPSPCLAGMSRSSSWTVPTSMETTSQGTSGSSAGPTTSRTNGRSERCSNESLISKRRTRVYDLLSAGSRERFTVLSSDGPLVVHNCLGFGYGMGWWKAAETFLKGPMGADPITFTLKEAEEMGVNLARFFNHEGHMELVRAMKSRLDEESLAVHCAVAQKIVYTWRNNNKAIVELWSSMSKVIELMFLGDEVRFGPGGVFQTVRHGIVLPNGMVMYYPGLEPGEDGYTYLGGKSGKERVKVYGGSLTENLVQAFCRIIVSDQMLRYRGKYGYPIITTTHDEIAGLARDEEAKIASDRLLIEMKNPPAWCADLPLHAEGGFAQCYGEAK